MTARPTSGELSQAAREFVRENRAYLIAYATPLLAPLLVAEAMQRIGILYSHAWQWLAILLISFFTACFVLAWHRASLLGPRNEHKVNPLKLKTGEGRFIGLVFGIALVTLLIIALAIVPVFGLAYAGTPVPLVVLLAIVAFIAGVAASLRFMFMLPARSVNVNLTWKESWQISQGLVWLLFAASFRASIWLMLLLGVIAFVAFIILEVLGLASVIREGNVTRIIWTLPGAVAMFIMQGIPTVLINFVITARSVTILSRLYQWSVQNRPQPAEAAT